MKNIAISLLAAITIAAPALAETNYPRFNRMDLDKDGLVTLEEAKTSCKVKTGVFKYADENNDGKLTVGEVRRNFGLFQRC